MSRGALPGVCAIGGVRSMRFIDLDRGLCRCLALVLIGGSSAGCSAQGSSPYSTTGGSAAGDHSAGGATTAGSGGMLGGDAAGNQPPLVLAVAGTGGMMP